MSVRRYTDMPRPPTHPTNINFSTEQLSTQKVIMLYIYTNIII